MARQIILLLGLFLMTMNLSFGQSTDSSSIVSNTEKINQEIKIDSATVYVSFIVETTGKITNVKVDKIKCKKCNKEFKESLKSEALRIISTIPDLEPRKERIKFVQPFKFRVTHE